MTAGVVFAPALASVSGFAPPLRGAGLTDHVVFHDAALAWEDGLITFAGRRADLPLSHEPVELFHIDGAVVPGFVDCHTHVPFVGWRADEFEARLAGRTYRDLHTGGGGGIYRSARMLAEASDDEVLAYCRPFLVEMLEHGTTALEFKTGYGLSVEGELRQARLARRLADEALQTVTVTLLACHAIPEQSTREAWVDEVCRRLIPEAAREGLVDAVDVYVEDIAFSGEDLERVATRAREHGLEVRAHADQLASSGAAEVAARLAVRSADHLNHVDPGGDGGARRFLHDGRIASRLDDVPGRAPGPGRRPGVRRCRHRDRNRLQPRHVALPVDAGGHRGWSGALPIARPRALGGRHAECCLGTRTPQAARIAGARETGGLPSSRCLGPRDGPVPTRSRPGAGDLDRWQTRRHTAGAAG